MDPSGTVHEPFTYKARSPKGEVTNRAMSQIGPGHKYRKVTNTARSQIPPKAVESVTLTYFLPWPRQATMTPDHLTTA